MGRREFATIAEKYGQGLVPASALLTGLTYGDVTQFGELSVKRRSFVIDAVRHNARRARKHLEWSAPALDAWIPVPEELDGDLIGTVLASVAEAARGPEKRR